MSEVTIYNALRAGGLSPAGACAVMGNMFCESALISNNVENRCPMSDSEYTAAVNDGRISLDRFANDKYGYGLCQWTFWSRKKELWELANKRHVSIADEEMQCELCLTELARDYSALYQQLCSCTPEEMLSATDIFCRKFENPEAPNVSQRYQAAVNFYSAALKYEQAAGDTTNESGCTDDGCPIDIGGQDPQQGEPYVEIGVPPLRNGSTGIPVAMLQAGLKKMGYYTGVFNRIDGIFGERTEAAVKAMQAKCNQRTTGIVDQGTWQIMFL